jgi:LPXTG-motif cell wall-anchored protein
MMTVAVGAATVFGAAVFGPGTAGADDTADAGLRSLCAQVADRAPGGAELTTDPAPGARLQAGETVSLTLWWDEQAFSGQELQRVAHCIVTLDGRLRLDLSASEAPSANDGVYRGSFVVPADLAPGDCLCVLGVASGVAPDGGPTRLGGSSCVTVTDPAPPIRPPASSPPGPDAPPPTSPPAEPPTSVLPATQSAPPEALAVPAGQPMPLPLAELPRTGPSGIRLLMAVAGLSLVFGGGGVAVRRRHE